MKFYRPFREWPPLVKILIIMLLVSLTVFLHNLIFKNTLDMKSVMSGYRGYLQSFSGIIKFTILIPVEEEFLYRGPAFIVLVSLLQFVKNISKEKLKKWLERGVYAIAILILVISTFIWAGAHNHYTLTLFGFGLLWGGLMIYKRNFFYSVLFHSGANVLAMVGIYIRFSGTF